MSPDQLRAELARLNLSQVGAARFLRVDKRTIGRWLAGDTIPWIVELLLPRLNHVEVGGRAQEAPRAAFQSGQW